MGTLTLEFVCNYEIKAMQYTIKTLRNKQYVTKKLMKTINLIFSLLNNKKLSKKRAS